ncbi:MAG: YkvA family protein [Elusimicrobiota bacterium]
MNLTTWKEKAKKLKDDAVVLYLIFRDKRTPLYIRILAVAILVYAISPFDLIPDFIPVVGYLDDLIIIPLGIMLVMKLTPPDLLAEHRAKAPEKLKSIKKFVIIGGIVIVFMWAAFIFALISLVFYLLRKFSSP